VKSGNDSDDLSSSVVQPHRPKKQYQAKTTKHADAKDKKFDFITQVSRKDVPKPRRRSLTPKQQKAPPKLPKAAAQTYYMSDLEEFCRKP